MFATAADVGARSRPGRRPFRPTTPSRWRGGCGPSLRIVTQTGAGQGDALAAGFAACTGDIIVMIDADGSTDGREIIQFVSALVSGADFAKGSRYVRRRRQRRPHRHPAGRQQRATGHRQHALPDPIHRSLLRLQRLLGRAACTLDLDCERLRGRDADEHPGGQGGTAGARGAQPRAQPHPRRVATCGRSATGCGCCKSIVRESGGGSRPGPGPLTTAGHG